MASDGVVHWASYLRALIQAWLLRRKVRRTLDRTQREALVALAVADEVRGRLEDERAASRSVLARIQTLQTQLDQMKPEAPRGQ